MFHIDDLQRIVPGKFRVVLTVNDSGILPALRFLRTLSEVAERVDRRIDLERRVLRRKEAAEAAEPAAIAERARILTLYRELPGSRAERIKVLRHLLADQDPGSGWTYDSVVVTISRAVREERHFRRSRAQQLAGEGRSCREIGQILGISPAQAVRLKNFAPECPRIDDLPPAQVIPLNQNPAAAWEEKNSGKR